MGRGRSQDLRDRVLAAIDSSGQGINRLAEDSHQAPDVTRCGGKVTRLRVPGAGEHATDQLVGHFDCGIGQAFLDVDEEGDQRRVPPIFP